MSLFSESKPLHLKYWNGRGLMEVPRMLLAIAGQFPGDYVDGRYTGDVADGEPNAFSSINTTLTANLGRMPCATTADGTIGQSAAINYYVATELGLMGGSTFEAAAILSIQGEYYDRSTTTATATTGPRP